MATSSDIARMGVPVSKVMMVAGACALLAVGVLVFFLFDPSQVPMFPVCQFHRLTGLDCPGCGAQRALHQLLHGNVIAAFRLNAMFVLSLPLFAWLGVRFMVRTLRNEPVDFRFKGLWFYLAAWFIFGVLRNLPFPIFAWFAA
jgi:hypothetical protein